MEQKRPIVVLSDLVVDGRNLVQAPLHRGEAGLDVTLLCQSTVYLLENDRKVFAEFRL